MFAITEVTDRYLLTLLADPSQMRPSHLSDGLLLSAPGMSNALNRFRGARHGGALGGSITQMAEALSVRLT
jgi:hypothetical protein